MRWINNLWFRVRAIVMPSRMERDLADEMSFHQRMEAEKLMADGMDVQPAEREARRRDQSTGTRISLTK